ncbi:hypothetical protein CC78DRAFT_580501 [Lojkania enalia]|uniref:Uncharacterized protein n=1 Tax=Lojkania enalia TaxID=147567 RepID=A0A9P4K995_9PLEO|nr:hypothetical protein CC78DRAFT_580501 [Didymosphaeria enalia]
MCDVGKKLVENGADVLTLGRAGMTNMKATVEAAVSEDMRVVDGVVADFHYLNSLRRKHDYDDVVDEEDEDDDEDDEDDEDEEPKKANSTAKRGLGGERGGGSNRRRHRIAF